MRSLIRRAGLALAAAGSLTLGSAAAGQGLGRAAAQGGPVPQANPSGPEDTAKEEQGRQLEMKVESALLADPVTFPCRLDVHVEDGQLAINGFVPTEAALQRVLAVARANCRLPMVDNVQVFAGMAVNSTHGSANELLKEAREAVKQELLEPGQNVTVKIGSNGLVILGGVVASDEEKMSASRCLRFVRGCAAVQNELQVGKGVSAASPAPSRHRGPAPAPIPVARRPITPAGYLPSASEIKPSPANSVPTVALGPQIEPVPPNRGPAAPEPLPIPNQVLKPAEWTPHSQILPASPSTLPAADPTPPNPLPSKSIASDAAQSKPKTGNALTPAPTLSPTTWSHPGSYSAIAASQQPTAAMPVQGPSQSKAYPPTTWLGRQLPVEDARAPYVTTGVAYFADTNPVPSPMSSTPLEKTPVQLRNTIAAVCGGKARDVEVVRCDPRCMLIRLKVRCQTEGMEVARTILRLPDLEPYRVDVKVQITP